MRNLISIIVPVYNVEEYLHQCIDSIINQTYSNLEIILVDDGSTDESGKICDEYTKKDNRIIVIHQKNQGQCVARKTGVNIACGEYIGFVDSDDWIEPYMYEKLLMRLLETDADFVDSGFIRQINNQTLYLPQRKHYNTIEIDAQNREDVIFSYLLPEKKVYTHIEVSLCFKLMKKNIIKKAQEYISDNLSYGEDGACVLYMLYFSAKIAFCDIYGYNYRQRMNSTSTLNDPVMTIYKNLIYYRQLCKFEEYMSDKVKYQQAIQYFMTRRIITFLNIGKDDLYNKIDIFKFPDEKSLENKNIIVYGAGHYGVIYYKQFKRNPKINIVCWADKNHQKYKHYNVVSSMNILNYDYDLIIISIKYEDLANEIKNELIGLGIPKDKLIWKPAIDILKENLLP